MVRTGEALLGELDRHIMATFGVSQPAATALAVIDGAGTLLTPSQVSERVLAASATMTATLDLLERRGWIRRVPNPADRRSVLIEITPEGRAAADQLLPGIRAVERSILSALTPGERDRLLDLLAKVLTRTAAVAASPPEPCTASATGPPGSTRSGPRQPPAPLTAAPQRSGGGTPRDPRATLAPRPSHGRRGGSLSPPGYPGDLPCPAKGAAIQSHDDEDQSMLQRGTLGVRHERCGEAELH